MKFYVNGTSDHNTYVRQSSNNDFIYNSSDDGRLIIRQAGLYMICISDFYNGRVVSDAIITINSLPSDRDIYHYYLPVTLTDGTATWYNFN